MVTIQKIVFRIRTANIEDAGTDGEVYVGFCGREFHIGTSYEDFERDAERTYSAGISAVAGEVNVSNPTLNDPRVYPCLIQKILAFTLSMFASNLWVDMITGVYNIFL